MSRFDYITALLEHIAYNTSRRTVELDAYLETIRKGATPDARLPRQQAAQAPKRRQGWKKVFKVPQG